MRGYGSHSFLNDYIRENCCRRIMEIGVDDGENAETMVKAASQSICLKKVEYYGFDLFTGSRMGQVTQRMKKVGCRFKLFKGKSMMTLPEALKDLPMMDLIFIDGGHSHETVKSDWENSRALMHDKTAVFFHNYDFAGVKKLVDSISRDEYLVEIVYPPEDYSTARVERKPR